MESSSTIFVPKVLWIHVRHKHGIGERKIPEKPLKCEQCELEFRSYKGLWTHKLKVQKSFIVTSNRHFILQGYNSLIGKRLSRRTDVGSSFDWPRKVEHMSDLLDSLFPTKLLPPCYEPCILNRAWLYFIIIFRTEFWNHLKSYIMASRNIFAIFVNTNVLRRLILIITCKNINAKNTVVMSVITLHTLQNF